MGLVQSGEGPNTTVLLAGQCLNWDTGFFPAFGLKVKHWLFLGLKPASLRTGTTPSALLVLGPSHLDRNKSVGSPRFPACWLTPHVLGLANLQYRVSPFLIKNLSHWLFLWRTLANTRLYEQSFPCAEHVVLGCAVCMFPFQKKIVPAKTVPQHREQGP